MARYDYKCQKCGKIHEEWHSMKDEPLITCCGSECIKLITGGGSYEPFTPYWSENMSREPVYIKSREHRRQLLKDKKLEIISYKKSEYEGYRPMVNGHKMSEHQYQVAQKKGFKHP